MLGVHVVMTKDLLERQEWIVAMLLGLGLVLIFEVLLLRPSQAPPLTSDWALEEFESIDEKYRVGCTGCGTVFDRRPNQLNATVFACPNCSRQGAHEPPADTDTRSARNARKPTVRFRAFPRPPRVGRGFANLALPCWGRLARREPAAPIGVDLAV